ncbi:MAG: hypothetical protein MZU91_02560 [Desulfosudis oleivorans]|nr:hypothetical protein [Desulfosudis oleivorans]
MERDRDVLGRAVALQGDLGAEMGLVAMAEAVHRFSGTVGSLSRPVISGRAGPGAHDHMCPVPTRSEVCCLHDALAQGIQGHRPLRRDRCGQVSGRKLPCGGHVQGRCFQIACLPYMIAFALLAHGAWLSLLIRMVIRVSYTTAPAWLPPRPSGP